MRVIAEFVAAFPRYLRARQHETLRDALLGFYEESHQHAEVLPTGSALGDFMRFQRASFQRVASIGDTYRAALDELSPTDDRPAPPPPVFLFAEAGKEDQVGNYVLHKEAQRFVRPGVQLSIEPSYVYDPPGGGAWT